MMWLELVLKGVSSVVTQWMSASEEDRKAIEARALDSIREMVATDGATGAAHNARTAATLAEIDRAIAATDITKP